jgi:hypothetical protein
MPAATPSSSPLTILRLCVATVPFVGDMLSPFGARRPTRLECLRHHLRLTEAGSQPVASFQLT